MLIPTLDVLPKPPAHKTGWPWTEESDGVRHSLPTTNTWPKITIVTPSFNQGHFLEETIRSVLLQGYPNLEYIVIDGGSTDDSAAVIKKYEPWLTYWTSEKDRGQAHALNKGFARASGEVHAWLNSDDLYFKNTLMTIAEKYLKSYKPTFWTVCGVEYFDEETKTSTIDFQKPWYSVNDWILGAAQLHQQGAFWSSAITSSAGSMREEMHYGFDKEFFTRLISMGLRYECENNFVAGRYRQHEACKWKSNNDAFKFDWLLIALQYLQKSSGDYKLQRKHVLAGLAYWKIRFSQDGIKSKRSRLADLGAAVRYDPRVLARGDFWGSLRRIVS